MVQWLDVHTRLDDDTEHVFRARVMFANRLGWDATTLAWC